MAQTAGSIYNEEEGNNKNGEHNILIDDQNIINAINQTADSQNIKRDSIEMISNNFGDIDTLNADPDNKSAPDTVYTIKNGMQLFQWLLILFCVGCNIYLLSKLTTQCQCSINSSADAHKQYALPTITPSISPSHLPTLIPSINPSKLPTIIPSNSPSRTPTKEPSTAPSKLPTIIPSSSPSKTPTKEPSTAPSKLPTMQPTLNPSASPTYFDGYFIGDFKFSLKNFDHGNWKLCAGDLLPIDGQYQQLFQQIGFRFGIYNDTVSNITYFQLPNVTGSTLAVAGNGYLIGDKVGSQVMTLTNNELPTHSHYTMYGGNDGPSCNSNGVNQALSVGQSSLGKNLCSNGNGASTWPSSSTGSGSSFSLYQPTTFIGNLFVYSGISL